ncbi:hypothetical protein FOA52_000508 [Chlamydomonas sp. UWO 241]|nr:hypothetical protein FOA52_000508 [Chlamydomonas sp. UWO 241]
MGALLVASERKLSSFNSQDLANTVWALATLGHNDAAFMGALLVVVERKLPNFKPQALANTAWALATLGHRDATFMGALLVVAKPKLASFTVQDLANTVWALSTLGYNDTAVMGALLVAAKPKLTSFNAQNLANTVWPLATLGRKDAAFMQAVLVAAEPKLASFNAQDLANTVWALATLGCNDAAFMDALLVVAESKLPSFTAQNLAKTAWALAVLDAQNAAFVDALIRRLVTAARDFSPSAFCQLFQFMLWLDTWQVATDLPPRLLKNCKQALLLAVGNTTASHTQLQVLDAVRQLPDCSGASSEHLTDDKLFSVDIAVQLPCGQKLAVEVDGPTHFLSNVPTVPNGATRLRNRLLEARGWRVVSVPAKEWDRHFTKGKQAAHDYLTSLGACG